MRCHAGVEFQSGKPCPECGAGLGEVCWPGINADLLEVVQLRKENERLRSALDRACRIALGTDLTREAAEEVMKLRAFGEN